jgi:hypothetical protein
MMRAGVLDQTEGSLLRKTLLIVFWMILRMILDVEVTDLLQLRWEIHILDYDAGFPILGAS